MSPSPVSREASRYSVALDMWLHTRCQVSKMVTYQVSKINIWYRGVYVFLGGLGWSGWVGFSDLLSGFGEDKYYTPRIIVILLSCSSSSIHLFFGRY